MGFATRSMLEMSVACLLFLLAITSGLGLFTTGTVMAKTAYLVGAELDRSIQQSLSTLAGDGRLSGNEVLHLLVRLEEGTIEIMVDGVRYSAPIKRENGLPSSLGMNVRYPYQSPLDELFEQLEMRDPDHLAVKQYNIFKLAAGKTARSILIGVGVRLEKFNLHTIAGMSLADELGLSTIGTRKTALFAVIPDNDSSFNFIVGMLYTQLFQALMYEADYRHGGRLPTHVHFVMDEFANVALPDEFYKLLSTMRSREISVSIILQNLAQLKALYKDSWESIVGNCDVFLYLGGNEQSTHKYVSELLGKETIDTNTYGQSKGRSGSYSINYQQSGRELLTPDEVRLLDNRYALLFIRGEYPVGRQIRFIEAPKYSLYSRWRTATL